ncbi:MAG: hypothetical protein OXC66_05760 [Roseovarius sp.]|nr:hypothetical protein [Roseovarius sp.]
MVQWPKKIPEKSIAGSEEVNDFEEFDEVEFARNPLKRKMGKSLNKMMADPDMKDDLAELHNGNPSGAKSGLMGLRDEMVNMMMGTVRDVNERARKQDLADDNENDIVSVSEGKRQQPIWPGVIEGARTPVRERMSRL